MKVGERVYILSGLVVEEWEVYQIDGAGEPWVKRDNKIGMRANHYLNYTYLSLDGAVSAAKNARARAIKRCARELERLAINTNVKVALMKKPKPRAEPFIQCCDECRGPGCPACDPPETVLPKSGVR
jgi:hypothetical protein